MEGLRTTIYKVSDIEAAKNWYEKAFEVVPYFDESFYVGFSIKGYELGLQPEGNDAINKSDNVVSYWGVSDIKKSYTHFLSVGAVSHEEPYNVGGEIMVAVVKDPWDNCIGLIYNPTFKIEE